MPNYATYSNPPLFEIQHGKPIYLASLHRKLKKLPRQRVNPEIIKPSSVDSRSALFLLPRSIAHRASEEKARYAATRNPVIFPGAHSRKRIFRAELFLLGESLSVPFYAIPKSRGGSLRTRAFTLLLVIPIVYRRMRG